MASVVNCWATPKRLGKVNRRFRHKQGWRGARRKGGGAYIPDSTRRENSDAGGPDGERSRRPRLAAAARQRGRPPGPRYRTVGRRRPAGALEHHYIALLQGNCEVARLPLAFAAAAQAGGFHRVYWRRERNPGQGSGAERHASHLGFTAHAPGRDQRERDP